MRTPLPLPLPLRVKIKLNRFNQPNKYGEFDLLTLPLARKVTGKRLWLKAKAPTPRKDCTPVPKVNVTN